MAKHLWQKELQRSRSANRLGLVLMVTLILVLVLSVLNGLRTLAVQPPG